jgi:hypothetical protein
VAAGSITVTQASTVPSQNIALNQANQTLAAIRVEVKGEAIDVSQILFDIATTGSATSGTRLTDVSLVDANGSIVAGPVDAAGQSATVDQVTFTDTVSFPIGVNVYTVKGKTPSTAANNMTYRFTTNPGGTDWTTGTVRGQVTGTTITPGPSGDQALQTMTVRAATLELSVAVTPAAQNVVAGTPSFTFANYQLDASGSGEDVRMPSIPLEYGATNTPTNLTACQLYDGAVSLTTGSNVVDPSAEASSTAFTFDSPLVIAKGTVKTLALKCNISSSAAAGLMYQWGYDAGSSPSATGVTSGQSVTITENTSHGQYMTIVGSGTLTAALDASSPSYRVAAANTTGNTMSILRFSATNEDIRLDNVPLRLTNTSSSSASDILQVTLWDGATKVGTAVFSGSNTIATSTLSSEVIVPKDGSKLITVKADFTEQGTGKPGTPGAFVAIDYDNRDTAGSRGTGQSSGSTITIGSGATASQGMRVFRSIPTLEKLPVPTNTLSNGDKVLLRWKVTAGSDRLAVAKFTIAFSTTTATVSGLNVYCFTTLTGLELSSECSGLSGDGGFLATDYSATEVQTNWVNASTQWNFWAETSGAASTTVEIPAGGTRYFQVRGTVSGSASGASVGTQLEGDAAYVDLLANAEYMFAAATATDNTSLGDNDFIWSPISTSTGTASIDDFDWTNGYGVTGLPGTNMTAEVLSQ